MSTVNVRDLYDAQSFTSGESPNPSLEDTDNNTIKVEFLQGSISNSPVLLTYTTDTNNFYSGWWNSQSATDASAFLGTNTDLASSIPLPLIGSILSNKQSNNANLDTFTVPSGWLQFSPANSVTDNLVIKVAVKENKKITGYTIYYHDLDNVNTYNAPGLIGITSGIIDGNQNIVHDSIATLQMGAVISGSDIDNANWENETVDTLASLKYEKDQLNITNTGFVYIEINRGDSSVLKDPALIKLEFTVEDDALAPPTVTFPSGTVTFGNDSKIDKTPDGIAWQYSTNGTTYNDIDTGSSYQLPVGTYNAETFYVRNNDGSRESTPVTNQNQIIVRPPPPTVDFPTLSPVQIENATATITSLGTGASEWQYSINAGEDWSNGSGTTFSLLAGTYAINKIQVRNGSGTNWSTTINNSSQIVVTFSPPTVNFPGSGENGIVNITLGNSATAWQYSIDSGVSFSNGSGTKFTLQPETYAQNQIQVHNGDGTNWSATENNGSEIVISAPPTPPPEPVSTTEPVDIRKSYYPESKVNSTSNSLFNKVYSQKLLTSVDKIERTPLELKKDKSVEQYHNGTQDRLLRIKSKAMNNK